MSYGRVNWVDGEAGNTPINAQNLNKMDEGIANNDNAILDINNKITSKTLWSGSQALSTSANTVITLNDNIENYSKVTVVYSLNWNNTKCDTFDLSVSNIGPLCIFYGFTSNGLANVVSTVTFLGNKMTSDFARTLRVSQNASGNTISLAATDQLYIKKIVGQK